MSAARKTRLRAPARDPAADMGPMIRINRGDVVAEFRPDPDAPGGIVVRGARAAQGGHDYLHRRGSLDAAQHAAASRYSAAWHGAGRSGCATAGLLAAGRLAPSQRGHPTEAALGCAADIRLAHAALGPGQAALVQMVVLRGLTLGVVGGAAGEGDQVTLGRLRAALDRLAEMWGVE